MFCASVRQNIPDCAVLSSRLRVERPDRLGFGHRDRDELPGTPVGNFAGGRRPLRWILSQAKNKGTSWCPFLPFLQEEQAS